MHGRSMPLRFVAAEGLIRTRSRRPVAQNVCSVPCETVRTSNRTAGKIAQGIRRERNGRVVIQGSVKDERRSVCKARYLHLVVQSLELVECRGPMADLFFGTAYEKRNASVVYGFTLETFDATNGAMLLQEVAAALRADQCFRSATTKR
jgi:hypothetical protein